MNNIPRVSVVIPTYNRAWCVEGAIQSVLNQTFQDFELIVLDDGSTDNTAEILEPYRKDERIRCFFEIHSGASLARNKGIEKARAPYVAFLDSDDLWFPDKLEWQTTFLDEHPEIAFVHGSVEMMDMKGQSLPEETGRLRALYRKAQKRGEDYTGLSEAALIFSSAAVFRKRCLEQAGCFDPALDSLEDLDLYLRITFERGQIGFLGGPPVARYRYRGSISHSNPTNGRSYLSVFQKQIALLEETNQVSTYSKAYRNFLLHIGNFYYSLREWSQSRYFSLRAIRFDWRSLFKFSTVRNILISFVAIFISTFFREIKSTFLPKPSFRRASPYKQMARIGIDATAISPTGKGVARYQKNIVHALAQLESQYEYFVFFNQAYSFPPFVIENSRWHFIPVRIWKTVFWEQVDVPRWINRLGLDLFHTTADRLSYFGGSRFMLTLFEVPDERIRLLRQAKMEYSIYHWLSDFSILTFFPRSLKRAEKIIVSSQNTQRELIHRYTVDSQKIRVIALSHESVFKPSQNVLAIREELGIPAGYILHFSTRDPRENTIAVLKAFQLAKDKLKKGIKLLIIGSLGTQLKKTIDDNHMQEDVICRGYLDEDELVKTYQGALLYLDPSLYEGFAFQVLEAMACGIPVVTSKDTSTSELVGEAGVLLDPQDVSALAQRMVQILTDENLWNQMRARGLARAEAFSWEKTARETLNIYNEILNEKETMCYSS